MEKDLEQDPKDFRVGEKEDKEIEQGGLNRHIQKAGGRLKIGKRRRKKKNKV